MTITTITTRTVPLGNGVTTVFTYGFLIPDKASALVKTVDPNGVETTKTVDVDYTINGLGAPSGGSVTYPISGSPLPSGWKLIIARAVAETQAQDFSNQDGQYPAQVMASVDKLTEIVQQHTEKLSRAPLIPMGDDLALSQLPPKAARASLFFSFDANGQPLMTQGGASVPVSTAMTPVVQASTLTVAKDLLGVPYKNAVVDFGAVGDDATNNDTAMTSAVNWVNATGGFVFWPRGIYRFNTAAASITALGGGFIGAGPGMAYGTTNVGPASGASYGTVFRLNHATADLITIGTTARGFTVRDIGFWPVPFKTAGYAIHDRGLDTLIENVHIAYSFAGIKAGGGSNGSTYRHIRTFAIWGEGAVTTRGTTNAIADWAQGIVIEDFENYQPLASTPVAARWQGAWATGQAVTQYDLRTANGYVWQATNAGTTLGSGSGPTVTSLYTNAGDPTMVFFNDNGVLWRMIGTTTGACINIDSNSVVITVSKALCVGAMFWGIICQNTLSSTIMPQSVKIVNSLCDHNSGDAVFLSAGYSITLENTDCRYSVSGRGLTAGASYTGNLWIKGGHFWANALDGIQLPPITAANAAILGAKFNANGVKTATTYSGILIGANTTKFEIIGCDLGADPSNAGTQQYGLNMGAGCDNFCIDDCIALGNGTGGYNMSSGRDVATKIFGQNIGTVTGFTADAEGSWTPVVAFATPGDTNAFTYTHQAGRYQIKDGWCTLECSIQTGAVTHTTASGNVQVTGLSGIASHVSVAGLLAEAASEWAKFTKAGYTQVMARFNGATSTIDFICSGSGQNAANLTAADHTTGDSITLRFTFRFKVA